jgi:hypothetical protein
LQAEVDGDELLQCLRTYALVEKVEDAEVLFREVVVAPFAKTFVIRIVSR